MATAKEWTPETAIEALTALYGRYKDRPDGERLTQETIRRLVGVRTVVTVNRWLRRKNSPEGLPLDNLVAFLKKAGAEPGVAPESDSEWILKAIAADHHKTISTKGK